MFGVYIYICVCARVWVCVCVSCCNKQVVIGQLSTREMQGDRALSTGHGCVPANIFLTRFLYVKDS